jgi:hypothetical protein
MQTGQRPLGVTIPQGQLQNREDDDRPKLGNPRTVRNAVRANFVAIEYTDINGKFHTDVVLEVGNQLYMPPNSEQWTVQLKPLADWLLKGTKALLDAQRPVSAGEVPVEDKVDIT